MILQERTYQNKLYTQSSCTPNISLNYYFFFVFMVNSCNSKYQWYDSWYLHAGFIPKPGTYINNIISLPGRICDFTLLAGTMHAIPSIIPLHNLCFITNFSMSLAYNRISEYVEITIYSSPLFHHLQKHASTSISTVLDMLTEPTL